WRAPRLLRTGGRSRGRPRRAALVAGREDPVVGHRLHGAGVGAPLGRGPFPRAGRHRSAGGRTRVGPDRAARTRGVEGGRYGTTSGPAPRRRRALRTPDR